MKKDIPMKHNNILGTDIAVTDMQETVHYLTDGLANYGGEYICVANVHTAVMAYDDEAYRQIQNHAAMAIPDGKPLSLLCRIRGFREAQRVAGPDLMARLLEESLKTGRSHYFYGSSEQTLQMLEEKLRTRYPGIRIAGMYSPPFRELTEAEDQLATGQIKAADADYIWVGLGAPKQEKWMYRHERMFRGIMIGVGAAFDFHAGTVKRAPRWMQEWCLEWLFRLFQDPRRLFKRYIYTNFRFIWLIIRKKRVDT